MIGGADPEEVREMYWGGELTGAEIANELNVTVGAIFQGMQRHGIPRRTDSEAHRLRLNRLDGGLSPLGLEVLVGEMLGDGNLRAGSGHSALFQYGVADRDHRDWLTGVLRDEGFACRMDERRRRSRTEYELKTLAYLCLKNVHDVWYTGPTLEYTSGGNPSKRVPEGVEITPTVLLHWWLGDGSWDSVGRKTRLSTNGFTDMGRARLERALADVGIETTVQKGSVLYVLAASRDAFFDFMADPPAGVKPHRFP